MLFMHTVCVSERFKLSLNPIQDRTQAIKQCSHFLSHKKGSLLLKHITNFDYNRELDKERIHFTSMNF